MLGDNYGRFPLGVKLISRNKEIIQSVRFLLDPLLIHVVMAMGEIKDEKVYVLLTLYISYISLSESFCLVLGKNLPYE